MKQRPSTTTRPRFLSLRWLVLCAIVSACGVPFLLRCFGRDTFLWQYMAQVATAVEQKTGLNLQLSESTLGLFATAFCVVAVGGVILVGALTAVSYCRSRARKSVPKLDSAEGERTLPQRALRFIGQEARPYAEDGLTPPAACTSGKTVLIAEDDLAVTEALSIRLKELGITTIRSPDAWEELKPLVCDLLGVNADQVRSPAPSDAEDDVNLQTTVGREPLATTAVLGVSVSDRDEPAKPTSQHKRPRVLCIDDDPNVSKSIAVRLRPYGVDVIRAFNGMQGYWMGLDTRPDVIITDLRMPEGEGNYVFGRFQSHPLTKDVPVIVLTGETNPAMKRTMLSLGVAAYFTKPWNFEELLQELGRHIDLRPASSRTHVPAPP